MNAVFVIAVIVKGMVFLNNNTGDNDGDNDDDLGMQ